MKTIRHTVIGSILLLLASIPCFAVWSIEDATKERAAELGIEIWSKVISTNQVGVWLELKPQGKLKEFDHVGLEITAGRQTVVAARLLPTRQSEDRVTVAFYTGPAHLAMSKLTVYVRNQGRSSVGYRFTVKDIVKDGMPR